jgi:ketosteroid isomerase-like protein
MENLEKRETEVMTNTNQVVTTAVLEAFSDAWNRHDIDALMSFMTDDCVFEAAAGPDANGKRFEGYVAVRAAFAQAWQTFSDAHWGQGVHFVCGDRGVSEWRFTGTRADGMRIEANGCDLFTFKGGKIAVKSAFRKDRPLIGASKS